MNGKRGLLILDNDKVHTNDEIIAKVNYYNFDILFLPANTISFL